MPYIYLLLEDFLAKGGISFLTLPSSLFERFIPRKVAGGKVEVNYAEVVQKITEIFHHFNIGNLQRSLDLQTKMTNKILIRSNLGVTYQRCRTKPSRWNRVPLSVSKTRDYFYFVKILFCLPAFSPHTYFYQSLYVVKGK